MSPLSHLGAARRAPLVALGATFCLAIATACVADPVAPDTGGGKGDVASERDDFIPDHAVTATDGPDRIEVREGPDATVVSVNGAETAYSYVDGDAPRILIDALDGDDKVTIDGDMHSLKIRGGAGNDRIVGAAYYIYGGDGDDILELTGLLDNAVVSGGDGHDVIRCGDDPFQAALYGGAGDDEITAGATGSFVFGGPGDDTLNGSSGDDYLAGSDGNDRIGGGGGSDVLYGDDGDDTLSGGPGSDVLHGGPGDDVMSGDEANDGLFGGTGQDELIGGAGEDALAGGRGSDSYMGGPGRDVIYHQTDDTVLPDASQSPDELVAVPLGPEAQEPGHSITIIDNPDGDLPVSDAFRARVAQDLEALRSLPEGRALLAALDADQRRIRLTFPPGFAISNTCTPDDWEAAHQREGDRSPGVGDDGKPGTGALVEYQPHFYSDSNSGVWMPPITQLYHELVHAWNFARGDTPRGMTPDRNGVGTPNAELVAVGLAIDHDGEPSTPTVQPNEYYENLLRAALRLPLRNAYY